MAARHRHNRDHRDGGRRSTDEYTLGEGENPESGEEAVSESRSTVTSANAAKAAALNDYQHLGLRHRLAAGLYLGPHADGLPVDQLNEKPALSGVAEPVLYTMGSSMTGHRGEATVSRLDLRRASLRVNDLQAMHPVPYAARAAYQHNGNVPTGITSDMRGSVSSVTRTGFGNSGPGSSQAGNLPGGNAFTGLTRQAPGERR